MASPHRTGHRLRTTRGISDLKKADLVFDEWLKMAAGLVIIALLAAFVVGGVEMIIPLVVVGGVIFILFHAAKGFAQADRTRHQRRRNGE